MSRNNGQSVAKKSTTILQQFTDAIKAENTPLIKTILKDDNFDPSKQSTKIIRIVIETQNLTVFNLLLEDNRVDFTAGKYMAVKLTVEENQPDMLIKLLKLEGVCENKNATIFYNLLKKAADLGYEDIASLIINTKLISFEKALLWAIQHNHAFIVKKLLETHPEPKVLPEKYIKAAHKHNGGNKLFNSLINSNRVNVQKILPWAIKDNKLKLARALLTHPDCDPSYENNTALSECAKLGYVELFELLLAHPKTNPADGNNLPIRKACYYGHTKIVELLLATKDKGIDPNTHDNYCLTEAASRKFIDIVRLLMPYNVIHRLKLNDIIPIDSPNLLDEVQDFTRHPESYISHNPRLSSAQKKAFEILQLKLNIKNWEEEKIKSLSADPESAMQDETVTRSKFTYENKVKPAFNAQFLAHAEPILETESDEPLCEADQLKAQEASALIKIEENIRELILNTILAANPLQETIQFINLNKKELIQANDKELMRTARNDHFNSPSDRLHLAWRGYDQDAPYKGFCNLLTPPKKEKVLFTTVAANTEQNAPLLNTTASFYVRNMVAHYFLLVNDKADDKETIEARRANFIAELADMRSAHSHDYQNKQDGPSCYPGYLGRIANMGYEHALTKQTVSTKMFVESIIEPHIFSVFKTQLEICRDEQEGLELLQAITLLSETGWRAQNIFLGLEKYGENLIKIRQNFISQLGTQENNLIRINNELEKSGRLKLMDENTFNEQSYVFQYLLDPARGNLSGKLSHEYNRWVQKFYFAQDNIEQNKENQAQPPIAPLDKPIVLNNPYSSNAKQMQIMLEQNKKNALLVINLKKRLENILIKQAMFDLIQNQLILLPIFNLENHTLKAYGLFTEILTEVLFEAEKTAIEQLDAYLTTHIWENLSTNLNQEIQTKLEDHSDKDEFTDALEILNELAANQQKNVLEDHHPVYTPFRSIQTPPSSPSKKSATPKGSPVKAGRDNPRALQNRLGSNF